MICAVCAVCAVLRMPLQQAAPPLLLHAHQLVELALRRARARELRRRCTAVGRPMATRPLACAHARTVIWHLGKPSSPLCGPDSAAPGEASVSIIPSLQCFSSKAVSAGAGEPARVLLLRSLQALQQLLLLCLLQQLLLLMVRMMVLLWKGALLQRLW